MGDGDPQIEAGILSDKAAPGGGADATQLGDPPDLPVTIRQFQVKPQEERTDGRAVLKYLPTAGLPLQRVGAARRQAGTPVGSSATW